MYQQIFQHPGTDGYQADAITVFTDPNTNYRCVFSEFLDGDASEIGHNCQLV